MKNIFNFKSKKQKEEAIEATVVVTLVVPTEVTPMLSEENNHDGFREVFFHDDEVKSEIIIPTDSKERYQSLFINKDKDGNSALHIAAHNGDVDRINTIFEGFSAVEILTVLQAQNNTGGTPLHAAAGHGGVHAVNAILEKIAGLEPLLVQVKNTNGVTPIQAAARNGKKASLDALLAPLTPEIRADRLSETTNKGMNALHLAANNGHSEVALSLVTEHGADPRATCNARKGPKKFLSALKGGDTAADLAKKEKHHELATALSGLERDANQRDSIPTTTFVERFTGSQKSASLMR